MNYRGLVFGNNLNYRRLSRRLSGRTGQRSARQANVQLVTAAQ
ncbi:MAG: hypothetical protein KatS3mg111_2603 [Pirellulaceae bacterium]|nr:MAG: hypothetical protein KatS3mg111_2603 [Pirellulaceae bacterium]